MEATIEYSGYMGQWKNGSYYSILGLYWDNGIMETIIVYWGFMG